MSVLENQEVVEILAQSLNNNASVQMNQEIVMLLIPVGNKSYEFAELIGF